MYTHQVGALEDPDEAGVDEDQHARELVERHVLWHANEHNMAMVSKAAIGEGRELAAACACGHLGEQQVLPEVLEGRGGQVGGDGLGLPRRALADEDAPDARHEGEEEDEERRQGHEVPRRVVGADAQDGQQHEAQEAQQHTVPVLPAAQAQRKGMGCSVMLLEWATDALIST